MKKVKGTIMWAFLNHTNDNGKYSFDVCELSDKAVEALEEMGLEVRNKPEKGNYVTCRSNYPIKAYDAAGDEIIGVKVGNGSKGIVAVNTYDWINPRNKKEKGVGAGCARLVITDLIEYTGGDVAISEDDDDVL